VFGVVVCSVVIVGNIECVFGIACVVRYDVVSCFADSTFHGVSSIGVADVHICGLVRVGVDAVAGVTSFW